jgi:hypothetical protein
MDGVQAIDLINSWRRILIEGKPEQICPMLEDIERRFKEKGFVRDPAVEKTMNWHPHQRNVLLCFVGGPPEGPRLMMCLNRVSERRVRGSTYSLLGSVLASPDEVAVVIDDVIKNVIVPSTSSYGLKVTKPQLGLKSLIPPRTLAALLGFTDTAPGAFPLPATAETAWRKFLIAACGEEVAFDTIELTDWFIANGWSSEDARGLTEKFVGEAALLTEYAETIRG